MVFLELTVYWEVALIQSVVGMYVSVGCVCMYEWMVVSGYAN